MGLIECQWNLVPVRAERGDMNGGRVYPRFDAAAVAKTEIISFS